MIRTAGEGLVQVWVGLVVCVLLNSANEDGAGLAQVWSGLGAVGGQRLWRIALRGQFWPRFGAGGAR